MKCVARDGVLMMVILTGVLMLRPPGGAAFESADICAHPDHDPVVCEGEICCVTTTGCSTDPEFCHELFCDEYPDASICDNPD